MATMARSWHRVFGREFSLKWKDTAIRLVKVKVWHVRGARECEEKYVRSQLSS